MSQDSTRSSFDATQSGEPSPSPLKQSAPLKRKNADADGYLNKHARATDAESTPEGQKSPIAQAFSFSDTDIRLFQLQRFYSSPTPPIAPPPSLSAYDTDTTEALGKLDTVFVPSEDQSS